MYLRNVIKTKTITLEDGATVTIRQATVAAMSFIAQEANIRTRIREVFGDCIIRCEGFKDETGDMSPEKIDWNKALSNEEVSKIFNEILSLSKMDDEEKKD